MDIEGFEKDTLEINGNKVFFDRNNNMYDKTNEKLGFLVNDGICIFDKFNNNKIISCK